MAEALYDEQGFIVDGDNVGSSGSSGWLDSILNAGGKIFTGITARDVALANAKAKAAQDVAKTTNWKFIGGIAAAGVVLLLLVFFFGRK